MGGWTAGRQRLTDRARRSVSSPEAGIGARTGGVLASGPGPGDVFPRVGTPTLPRTSLDGLTADGPLSIESTVERDHAHASSRSGPGSLDDLEHYNSGTAVRIPSSRAT